MIKGSVCQEGYSNPERVNTEHQKCKICAAQTENWKESKTNPQVQLETLTPFSPKLIEWLDRIQQGYGRTELHHQAAESHWDQTTTEHAFLPRVQRPCIKIDCILSPKANLNTFKRIEITQNLFSNYNGLRLEISHRKIT